VLILYFMQDKRRSLKYSILSLQLIFRKVADVKRERELAERRKNEPQLEATQDHLVRKLFSRFRKGGDRVSTGSSLQTDTSSVKDIEKGDSARASDSENDASLSQEIGNKVVKVFPASKVSTEKDDLGPVASTTMAVVAKTTPAPAARPKGKWGALMGSGGGGGAPPPPVSKTITATDSLEDNKVQQSTPGSSSEPPASSSSSAAPEPSKLSKIKQAASGNKVFPTKSKPTISGRQETIEELTETTSVGSPAKDMVVAAGSPSAAATAALMTATASAEYQQIISNMMDFKVDVKLEIQRLNQKMNKLEDLLGDIVVKLNQQLNGPQQAQTSQYSHRLLSPTSPMHSDTGGGGGRDESPASGGEDQEGGGGRKGRSGHHHHHKHRDRDKRHHKDRDKTPDTLSPESRLSSADVGSGGRSKDKRGGRSKERPKTASSSTSGGPSATTRTTSTSGSAVQQMLEDEIQEQGSSSKTSSAGSKEPLLPPKAVIIPTGPQRSREFL
jgi:hypothetical protein